MKMHQHGNRLNLSPRVFCIGRNYTGHVSELNSAMPEKPVVFIKPATCLIPPGRAIRFPRHGQNLQHEVEVVIRIGKTGKAQSYDEAFSMIDGVTLGLDLTLRDVQTGLKQKGLPWEIAKSFDQSAPIGEFLPYDGSLDLTGIEFSCTVNGSVRQQGNTRDMIFSIDKLIMELSTVWFLHPGDMIYTGTPSGVGPLCAGDRIVIESEQLGYFTWNVVA
jgi:2-keto-4-pentenoate hydratase/2-oxohepta-3-ene-1,7-dioic acid hydratase in catechol pathway